MKKRFLFPLVGTGLLTAVVALGTAVNSANIKHCNKGVARACEGLINIPSLHDQVTNPDFKQIIAKHKADEANAEAARKAEAAQRADAAKTKKALYNLQVKIETAAMNCEKAIKPTLKDPRSFRKVSHDLVDISNGKLTVSVSYIATNSFGGPVRGAQSCSYAM